jgi:phosphate uptake regulator/aminoglycoside phosphotransferase
MPDRLTRIGVEENLRFQILEVRKQLKRINDYLRKPSPSDLEKIIAGDDYIDNLKRIIHRKSYTAAAEEYGGDGPPVELLRTVNVVATNLERISDFCEDIAGQVAHIEDPELLRRADFRPLVDQVVTGLALVEKALFRMDVQKALGVCRIEAEMDRAYDRSFNNCLDVMRQGRGIQGQVTIIFIHHYFERMGDALLNIGEAIISAALGERIKIDQFRELEDSLEAGKMDDGSGVVTLHAIGETRSGCRIDEVRGGTEGDRSIIFKSGRRNKLLEEKKCIERWHEVMPGMAPMIHSFHEGKDHSSLLVEYLPGSTLEATLLQGRMKDLKPALNHLFETLTVIWEKTREAKPQPACFIEQLAARMDDIYAVHSGFRRAGSSIGGLETLSFEELMKRARKLEKKLEPPFSVLGHGDFNVDNIIFDPKRKAIHFIDLHRSRMMDYAQDISVFLVSCQRLQVFEAPVRRRITQTTLSVFDFARSYAAESGDDTFSVRLALGLARSFASSTRFILDRKQAKTMFLRSRYLLERLLATDPKQLYRFTISRDVLVG